MDFSLYSQVDTKEEDVFCLCSGRRPATEKEWKLLTGHRSLVKLWAVSDTARLLHTVRLPVEGDVTCICQSPANEYHYAVSVETTVLLYDSRELSKPLWQFQFNGEEINEVSFNPKGDQLSSCDDSGEIKIIDLSSGTLFRTLTGAHSNICSCARFSPSKPWEVVSGGLDCKIVRWDLGRGRAIHEVTVEQAESGGYLVNPPMVHCIETMSNSSAIACGLGDGSVSVRTLTGKGLELVCSASLHSSAVSQVRCLESTSGDERRSIIVSGGNDSKIVVSELVSKAPPVKKKTHHKKAKVPAVTMAMQTLARVKHASKVNWMAVEGCVSAPSSTEGASAARDSEYRVYVADQSQLVSVYHCVL